MCFRKVLERLSRGAYRNPEVARKVQGCQDMFREIQRCSVVSRVGHVSRDIQRCLEVLSTIRSCKDVLRSQ